MKPFAVFLLLAPALAIAAVTPVTHTFVPSNPTTADVIRLRTDVQGCFSIFGAVTVLPNEPAIEVRFEGSDLPCEPDIPANVGTPRFADVGLLPAGTYATHIYSCGFGPMGTTCDVIQSGSLTVMGGSSARFIVPSLSQPGAMSLMAVVLLAGLWARRRA